MIYAILAVIAAFSGGFCCGWRAAVTGFCLAVQNGTMQELIEDYEEAFGKPCNKKE